MRNNPRGVGYMKIDGQDSSLILVPSYTYILRKTDSGGCSTFVFDEEVADPDSL